MSQSAPENWALRLTPAGVAALKDEDYNPDDAPGYLAKLAKDVPGLGDIATMYLREALRSYAARSYLAATVMLGVASEAAILDMAERLTEYYGDTALRATLRDPRIPYSRKFQEVRKRLETRKSELPADVTDGMSLTFDSILDLLRINRNDAGHPTGKHFGRDDCFIALRMAIRYLRKIIALTTFFSRVS
jgi:hypothetical protein